MASPGQFVILISSLPNWTRWKLVAFFDVALTPVWVSIQINLLFQSGKVSKIKRNQRFLPSSKFSPDQRLMWCVISLISLCRSLMHRLCYSSTTLVVFNSKQKGVKFIYRFTCCLLRQDEKVNVEKGTGNKISGVWQKWCVRVCFSQNSKCPILPVCLVNVGS